MGPGGDTDEAHDLSPGTRVGGRYRIDAPLGRGGMGAVYRAHDELEKRPVALKLLHQKVFADQRHLRTKHEFRAMVQLRHPRMVEVRDYGFLASGAPFFVMELLEGKDLAGSAALPLPTVYRVVAAVADALGFMHSRGYVHRDVKPANVHLGEGEAVKLMDFGTVELTGAGAGTIAGTVRYLAPESHYGAAADPRVDLYALGILAYELTTGSYPFAGNVVGELLESKLAHVPPLDQVREGVPAPFAKLVDDLLAPEPQARPRSCQEVLARIAAIAGSIDAGFELSADVRTPALAGRKNEMLRLRAELATAAEGKARALFLIAPAGAGKTRILDEALLEVRVTGTQVATAEPRGFGRQPYETLRALLTTMLHQPGGEAALAKAGGPDALGILYPGRTAPTQKGRDPVAEREDMHAGVGRFITALTAEHPVAIGVDDIHVADAASLDALASVVVNCPDAPFALCGTIREGEVITTSMRRLLELPQTTRMELGPLGPAQIGELCTSTLGACEPSETLLADIHRTSGGNVYFVLEILRAMIARGAITRGKSGVALPAHLEEIDAPKSLADALLARMASVSPMARRTVTGLSLLGRETDIDTLAQILEASEDDFLDALVELRRGEFVDVELGRVRVHHPRVREVLVGALADDERRKLHRRVAEVLEARTGADAPGVAELAVHWDGAGERRRALELWMAAGDARYAAFAFHDAGQAYRRAEQLLDAAPPSHRHDIERKICDRIGRIGFQTEHNAAIPYLARAWVLHLQSGILSWIPTLRRFMPAGMAVGVAIFFTGIGNALRLRKKPFRTAVQSFMDAVASVSYLATCYSYTGRFSLAIEAAEALKAYVHSKTALTQSAVDIGCGVAYFHQGDFDKGIEHCESAVRILEADRSGNISSHDRQLALAGIIATRVWCDLSRGHTAPSAWMQRFDEVMGTTTVVIDAWAAQIAIYRAILKGRTDDVLLHWDKASRLPSVAQVVFVHDSIAYLAAIGLLDAGRVAEAGDIADRVFERATRLDNLQIAARARLVRGLCLREWGHIPEAEQVLRDALTYATHDESRAMDARDNIELELGDLAIQRGDLAEAETMAERVFSRTENYVHKGDLLRLRARRLQARIAHVRGDLAKARELYEWSLRWARDLELPLDIAKILHGLAAVHESAGNTAEQQKTLALCERTLRGIDNRYQLHKLGFAETPGGRVRRTSLRSGSSAGTSASSPASSGSAAPPPSASQSASPAPALSDKNAALDDTHMSGKDLAIDDTMMPEPAAMKPPAKPAAKPPVSAEDALAATIDIPARRN